MIIATLETLYMVFISFILSLFLGVPVGILLYISKKGGIYENKIIHRILDSIIVNITRAIPFVILIILLIPLSRLIVGKSYGTTAFIIPLAIGISPFVARIIYNALSEVDLGLVEAMQTMGANNFEIIFKCLIPESMPSIVSGMTLTIISLIGYSAIAGIIGGGGLGNLAVVEGFQRGNHALMYKATLVIILIVEIVQFIGHKITTHILEKRGKLWKKYY